MATPVWRAVEHPESSPDLQRQKLYGDWRDAAGLSISESRRDVGSRRSTFRRFKLATARQSSGLVRRRAFASRRNTRASTGGDDKDSRQSCKAVTQLESWQSRYDNAAFR